MFTTIKAWFDSKGGFSHVAAAVFAGAIAAYAAVPAFHSLVLTAYNIIPSWGHELILAVAGLIAWYKNTQSKPGVTLVVNPSISQKAPMVILTVMVIGMLGLTGCPNTSQQQKIATALQQVAVIVQGFQEGEIAAHEQGLIPEEDHQFIAQQELSIAEAGKAADSCIKTATNTAGTVTCINTAATAVAQIETQGGLYLKSAKAQNDFKLAMTGVQSVLASIAAILGGK